MNHQTLAKYKTIVSAQKPQQLEMITFQVEKEKLNYLTAKD